MEPSPKILLLDSELKYNEKQTEVNILQTPNLVPNAHETVSKNNETLLNNEKNETAKNKLDESQKSEEDKKLKRPNCFLSIPITNKNSLEKFQNLKEIMHKTHKDMQRISIPLEKLHLTLGVFNIDPETQLENAKKAMEESREEIKQLGINHPMKMSLYGLDSFSSGVLFVKLAGSSDVQEGGGDVKPGEKKVDVVNHEKNGVGENVGVDNLKDGEIKDEVESCDKNITKNNVHENEEFKNDEINNVGKKNIKDKEEDEKSMTCNEDKNVDGDVAAMEVEVCNDSVTLKHIQSLTDILLLKFKEEGMFDPSNSKPFKPHITVAKSSKAPFHLKKKYKKLIEKIKKEVEEQNYGVEEVKRIDLCWMTLMDENKTGYKIIHSIDLFE